MSDDAEKPDLRRPRTLKPKSTARQDALAKALRDNLRRRKAPAGLKPPAGAGQPEQE